MLDNATVTFRLLNELDVLLCEGVSPDVVHTSLITCLVSLCSLSKDPREAFKMTVEHLMEIEERPDLEEAMKMCKKEVFGQ